jgi:magnesium-transporting ATPase (P-type)
VPANFITQIIKIYVKENIILTKGDVIQIESSEQPLSVDCILLSGAVVADESSLTGEALPVAKTSILKEKAEFSVNANGKQNCLFAGCHVLEIQLVGDMPVTALVLATGAGTAKGKLIKDMLYPQAVMFVFIEHLKIVFPLLFVWGVILHMASIRMLGENNDDAWFYGMFTISQILSPLLPAVLVIGQSISAKRLAEKKIMCVDLQRITLAGKVKVFCFDKTGTLTKEGIEFIGVAETNLLDIIQNDISKMSAEVQIGMHICHSISMADGRHVGNFVDLEMFKATNASLNHNQPCIVNPLLTGNPLQILKRYEFVHSSAYMSVVCQDMVTLKKYVFLKGSSEKLGSLAECPENILDSVSKHSRNGCYVVALAYKEIHGNYEEMARLELESGCRLIGLILFRNELKMDSKCAVF